jgi:hypothetical protein
MDITIPSGQPAWRFMRYIRPSDERARLEPIYPLRPATRTIKLGIDVETVPEPSDGLLSGFLAREELIEVHLMVPKGAGSLSDLDGPGSERGNP